MDQVYTASPTTRRPAPYRKSQSEKNRLESQLGEDYPSAVALHPQAMCNSHHRLVPLAYLSSKAFLMAFLESVR